MQVESCLDVEFEAVVHLVREHKVESQTFEQFADAERVFNHVKTYFLVVGVDSDLRKHCCKHVFQTVHAENDVEQFVKFKTFADIMSVVVLHESVVIHVERVSVLGRERFERLCVVNVHVSGACIVVYNEAEVERNDVRVVEFPIISSEIAVRRFDVLAVHKAVFLAREGRVGDFDEFVDTLFRFCIDGVESVTALARCEIDVVDAHAEREEITVDIDVDCDRRIELQIDADGDVEVEFFDDGCNVGAAFAL